MSFDEQLPGWSDVLQIVGAAIVIYLLLIGCSRIIGPRSFSQMAAFDFAVTVAMGAIIGSTATGGVPLYGGVLGMITLFTVRGVVAVGHHRGLDRWLDNRPMLVMAGHGSSRNDSGWRRSPGETCWRHYGWPVSRRCCRCRP